MAPDIACVNSLYDLRAGLLRAGLRASSRQCYLESCSRALVESGLFRTAGIGRLKPGSSALDWLAIHGVGSKTLAEPVPGAATEVGGNDPFSMALREGKAFACEDALATPLLASWHSLASEANCRALACLPISQEERPVLMLALSGFDPGFLSEAARPILDGIAADLACGLDGVDREERACQTERDLRASLAHKEAMLKEVHHRMKNNLQIVTSLLNLQAARVPDRAVQEALLETQHRVRSMALLHEALYRSTNLARLDFGRYAEQLCAHLLGSHAMRQGRVRATVRVEDVGLSLDQAVPCGLLISELVSNALKHAFPGERPGQITVEMKRSPDSIVLLKVTDDGVGLPESLDIAKAGTLGLKLVRILTDQLRGGLTVSRAAGTAFSITFPGQSAQ